MPGMPHDVPLPGPPNELITNAIVRLLRKHSGRGPTKARTYLSGDYIAVVLGDYVTVGAQTLLRHGRLDAFTIGRRAIHEAVSPEMIDAVERLSGRRVLAHLTSDHIDPAISIESFILEAQTVARSGVGSPAAQPL